MLFRKDANAVFQKDANAVFQKDPRLKFAGKYRSAGFRPVNSPSPVLNPKPALRDTGPRPSSLHPAQTGAPLALKPPANKYTGEKILGIAAMHKSNLVPIFNAEQAVDTATMRRG